MLIRMPNHKYSTRECTLACLATMWQASSFLNVIKLNLASLQALCRHLLIRKGHPRTFG